MRLYVFYNSNLLPWFNFIEREKKMGSFEEVVVVLRKEEHTDTLPEGVDHKILPMRRDGVMLEVQKPHRTGNTTRVAAAPGAAPATAQVEKGDLILCPVLGVLDLEAFLEFGRQCDPGRNGSYEIALERRFIPLDQFPKF